MIVGFIAAVPKIQQGLIQGIKRALNQPFVLVKQILGLFDSPPAPVATATVTPAWSITSVTAIYPGPGHNYRSRRYINRGALHNNRGRYNNHARLGIAVPITLVRVAIR